MEHTAETTADHLNSLPFGVMHYSNKVNLIQDLGYGPSWDYRRYRILTKIIFLCHMKLSKENSGSPPTHLLEIFQIHFFFSIPGCSHTNYFGTNSYIRPSY